MSATDTEGLAERLTAIEARVNAATPGPWYAGHLSDDFHSCNCRYIGDQGHAGGLAEVYVDNGKPVSEGGNDAPSLKEAKANQLFIAHARQDIPFLLSALRSPWRGEAEKALRDIANERQRQIKVHGWTREHDDDHDRGQIARAAGCYAFNAGDRFAWSSEKYQKAAPPFHDEIAGVEPWPWDRVFWKPKDPRRDLVRAGALIVAEIERLDRIDAALAALASPGDGGWRDIASAPKDGTSVLIGCDWEPLAVVGYWGANGNTPLTEHDKGQPEWRVKWDDTIINGGFEATHWCPLRPLPPPPVEDGERK